MIALAVAAVLFVAISIFGSISGAHFNPIVSLAFLVKGQLTAKDTSFYIASQFLGGAAGAALSNWMFSRDLGLSEVARISPGSFVGEIVASTGLVLLILLLVQQQKAELIAGSVALWILAGHLFTSSTSFANPAVSLGRVFSQAPSSINLDSAMWFVLAQLVGLLVALGISFILSRKSSSA
jgi:glycerol uptake facilitator-like aquaporin